MVYVEKELPSCLLVEKIAEHTLKLLTNSVNMFIYLDQTK